MLNIIGSLMKDFERSYDLENDAYRFLEYHSCVKTAKHSVKVARESKALAKRFGLDEYSALIAGAFHDISAIIPNNKRLKFAKEIGIDVLSEERELPLLLHQKISRFITQELFNVKDTNILNAIECHTTLRANATSIDIVLFVADKVQWDQPGVPPYLQRLEDSLNTSLKDGALSYIEHLLSDEVKLKVVHPWLKEAYVFYRGDK